MSGEFLSPSELHDLTDRQHKDAQAKALESAGIPFRRRKASQFESGRGHQAPQAAEVFRICSACRSAFGAGFHMKPLNAGAAR